MEWSLLVSVVLISTGRSKEVSHTSKALIERSLGSLFSHLGLQSRAGTRGLGGSASTSSLSIVLVSSIVNTVNFFTSDWDALIASRVVTLLENFLQKCSMGYNLYPWISLLEFTLETSYKP